MAVITALQIRGCCSRKADDRMLGRYESLVPDPICFCAHCHVTGELRRDGGTLFAIVDVDATKPVEKTELVELHARVPIAGLICCGCKGNGARRTRGVTVTTG